MQLWGCALFPVTWIKKQVGAGGLPASRVPPASLPPHPPTSPEQASLFISLFPLLGDDFPLVSWHRSAQP